MISKTERQWRKSTQQRAISSKVVCLIELKNFYQDWQKKKEIEGTRTTWRHSKKTAVPAKEWGSKKNQTRWYLDLGSLACSSVRKYISGVLATQAVVFYYDNASRWIHLPSGKGLPQPWKRHLMICNFDELHLPLLTDFFNNSPGHSWAPPQQKGLGPRVVGTVWKGRPSRGTRVRPAHGENLPGHRCRCSSWLTELHLCRLWLTCLWTGWASGSKGWGKINCIFLSQDSLTWWGHAFSNQTEGGLERQVMKWRVPSKASDNSHPQQDPWICIPGEFWKASGRGFIARLAPWGKYFSLRHCFQAPRQRVTCQCGEVRDNWMTREALRWPAFSHFALSLSYHSNLILGVFRLDLVLKLKNK